MLLNLPVFSVSEEAARKIEIFVNLVKKWQKTINLISPATINYIQERHVADSLQVIGLISREAKSLYDIGSGSGFPALIIAAAHPDLEVHLIESDQRKSQFLKIASREADIPAIIHNTRVETVDISSPDVITARALAPLSKLLTITEKWWHLNDKIELIFLKGQKAQEEIEKAEKFFLFEIEIFQSKTDTDGRILRLTNIRRIP